MEPLILNTNFQAVDTFDDYQSLIWVDRYSAYGDFEVYTTANRDNISKFQMDFFIWIEDSEHMMIVEDITIDSDVESGNFLKIVGRSLESILDRRIVWFQTTLNGNLQNGVKKLLNENVINPSDPKRKIPNFIFEESTDEEITNLQITKQFTGDNLYDTIKEICDLESIGFKISYREPNQLVFKLYSGKDRSYGQDKNPYVVFSPNFENIINSNYTRDKRELRNVALVAGSGEGLSRKTLTVGNIESSGFERRELYVDARDISSETSNYDTYLKKRGEEKLSEHKIRSSFDGEIETSQLYKYGNDFYMGDIVELENEYGITSEVRIVEFIFSDSKDDGNKNYPTFDILEKEE